MDILAFLALEIMLKGQHALGGLLKVADLLIIVHQLAVNKVL